MPRGGDGLDSILGGTGRQVCLEHPDRLTAGRDRHIHTRPGRGPVHPHPLCPQHPPVDGVVHRHPFHRVSARPVPIGKPHQITARIVRDQEGDPKRADHPGQLTRHRVHRVGGSGAFHRRQQLP